MSLSNLMIKNEFRFNSGKIVLGLIFNIIGTGLMYLVFVYSLNKILPRIDYIDLDKFMFSSIIGWLNAMLAVGLTSNYIFRYFKDSRGDYQRLAGTPISRVYIGFLARSLVVLIIHLIVSSLVLAALARYFPGFEQLLIFWAYALLALIFFIQVGIVIGMGRDQRTQFYWIFLIILPLFLMSGMIIPTHYYEGYLRHILMAFPSTVLIEGGRSILLKQPFNIVNILYLLGLNIFLFIGALYFFKRKLQR